MAASSFATALAFALQPDNDGQGVHCTPGDDGSWTAWGITLATLTFYRMRERLPLPTLKDLADITQDEVAAVYRALFWDAVAGDFLPAGPDMMVFDMANGTGPRPAARILQQVLGVTADGQIGPITIAAAQAADPATLIQQLGDADSAFYRTLKSDALFDRGWQRRNAERTKAALALAADALAPATPDA